MPGDRAVGDDERDRAKGDLIAGLYLHGLRHAPAVEPGPVGRAEVGQQPAVLLLMQPGVPAGHAQVRDREVAGRRPADREPPVLVPRQAQWSWLLAGRGAGYRHHGVPAGRCRRRWMGYWAWRRHGRVADVAARGQPLTQAGQPSPDRPADPALLILRQVGEQVGELSALLGSQRGIHADQERVLAQPPYCELVPEFADRMVALGV